MERQTADDVLNKLRVPSGSGGYSKSILPQDDNLPVSDVDSTLKSLHVPPVVSSRDMSVDKTFAPQNNNINSTLESLRVPSASSPEGMPEDVSSGKSPTFFGNIIDTLRGATLINQERSTPAEESARKINVTGELGKGAEYMKGKSYTPQDVMTYFEEQDNVKKIAEQTKYAPNPIEKKSVTMGILSTIKDEVSKVFNRQRNVPELNRAIERLANPDSYSLIQDDELRAKVFKSDESFVNEYQQRIMDEQSKDYTTGGEATKVLAGSVRLGLEMAIGGSPVEMAMNTLPPARIARIAYKLGRGAAKIASQAGLMTAVDPQFSDPYAVHKFSAQRDADGNLVGLTIDGSAREGAALLGRAYMNALVETSTEYLGGPLSKVNKGILSGVTKVLAKGAPSSVLKATSKLYKPETPQYVKEIFNRMKVFSPVAEMESEIAADIGQAVLSSVADNEDFQSAMSENMQHWQDPKKVLGMLIGFSILPYGGAVYGGATGHWKENKVAELSKRATATVINNASKDLEGTTQNILKDIPGVDDGTQRDVLTEVERFNKESVRLANEGSSEEGVKSFRSAVDIVADTINNNIDVVDGISGDRASVDNYINTIAKSADNSDLFDGMMKLRELYSYTKPSAEESLAFDKKLFNIVPLPTTDANVPVAEPTVAAVKPRAPKIVPALDNMPSGNEVLDNGIADVKIDSVKVQYSPGPFPVDSNTVVIDPSRIQNERQAARVYKDSVAGLVFDIAAKNDTANKLLGKVARNYKKFPGYITADLAKNDPVNAARNAVNAIIDNRGTDPKSYDALAVQFMDTIGRAKGAMRLVNGLDNKVDNNDVANLIKDIANNSRREVDYALQEREAAPMDVGEQTENGEGVGEQEESDVEREVAAQYPAAKSVSSARGIIRDAARNAKEALDVIHPIGVFTTDEYVRNVKPVTPRMVAKITTDEVARAVLLTKERYDAASEKLRDVNSAINDKYKAARAAMKTAAQVKAELYDFVKKEVKYAATYINNKGKTVVVKTPATAQVKMLELIRGADTWQDMDAAMAAMNTIHTEAAKGVYAKEILKSMNLYRKSTVLDKTELKKINDELDGIYFKKMSKKSIQLYNTLQQQYMDGELMEDKPRREQLLSLIQRKKKEDAGKYIKDFTADELRSLLGKVKAVEISARNIASTRAESQEKKEARITNDLISNGNNLDKTTDKKASLDPETFFASSKDFIARLSEKLNTAALGIKPTDLMLNAIDGFPAQEYTGTFYKWFSSNFEPHYNTYLSHMTSDEVAFSKIEKRLGLKEKDYLTIGLYATKNQKGGYDKLINLGFTADKIRNTKLNDRQMEMYVFMRENLDDVAPLVEYTLANTFNMPFKHVDKYFPFVTDWTRQHNAVYGDIEIMHDKHGDPIMRMAKERKGAGQQKVDISARNVYLRHMRQARYLVDCRPYLKTLSNAFRKDSVREAIGNVSYRALDDYLAHAERAFGAEASQIIPELDTIRRNFGVAILGFNEVTSLLQPFAIMNAWGEIGPLNTIHGLEATLHKEVRDWIRDNLPQVYRRVGSALEYGEIGSMGKYRDVAMKGITALDRSAASGVAAGAYYKWCSDHKEEVDFSAPLSESAKIYIQRVVRNTQASADPKDLPAWLSRTGNVSIMKSIFMFKTYPFSLLSYGIQGVHNIRNNPSRNAITLFYLLGSIAAYKMFNWWWRDNFKELLGGGEDEKKKAKRRLAAEVIGEAAGMAPGIANVMSMALYGRTGVPMVDSSVEVFKDIRAIGSGTAKSRARAYASLFHVVMRILGIPVPVASQRNLNDWIEAHASQYREVDKDNKNID